MIELAAREIAKSILERRSRRFPEGLIAQPFYGWVIGRNQTLSLLQQAYRILELGENDLKGW